MSAPERPVYLTIQPHSGPHLTFILPENFSDGYTNELEATAQQGTTHSSMHTWKSGKVDDVQLDLELAVGVSPGIGTPETLVRCIESLYNMALPTNPPLIGSVRVLLHGQGGAWFSRNYFVTSVKVEMGAPYDIDSGRPMKARVQLSLVPTYAPGESGGSTTPATRPHRDYSFAQG